MYAAQLERIQRTLAAAFRQFVPLTERPDLKEELTAIVSGNERLSPQEQAEIYRGQFWLRHRDALYEDFPGLLHLLGEDAFEELLRAYLIACPPDSWTLRDLGNHLATFAKRYDFDPAVAGAARDMAAFELAFALVWDGPDAAPVALERIEAIPADAWANARLQLHPVLTLLSLSHPVQHIRTDLKAKAPPREILPAPTFVALWRGGNGRVHYLGIESGEHALLTSLRDGATLGEACDRAASASDDPAGLASKLQRWFKSWTRRGWIVDVVTAD